MANLFRDTFTGADGALLTEHTPDENGLGWAWSMLYSGFPDREPTIVDDRLGGLDITEFFLQKDAEQTWAQPSSWAMSDGWVLEFTALVAPIVSGMGTPYLTLYVRGPAGYMEFLLLAEDPGSAYPGDLRLTMSDGVNGWIDLHLGVASASEHTYKLTMLAAGVTLEVDSVPVSLGGLCVGPPSIWSLQFNTNPGTTGLGMYVDDLTISGAATFTPGKISNTAQFSDFFAMIAPRAPGLAEITSEAEVRRAAIEFCRRTLAHQSTLGVVQTEANQAEYYVVDVLMQDDEVIERLLSVKFNGIPLEIVDPADLDLTDESAAGTAPQAALLVDPNHIRLFPAPALAAQSVTIRAAMRPSQNCTSLSPRLFERYADAIAHGALYRLLSTPQKSYTDPGTAGAERLLFEEAVNEAKEDAFRGNARSKRKRGGGSVSWC